MQNKLKAFFEKENIEFFRSFKIDQNIKLKYARKLPEWSAGGVVFLIPYKVESCGRNVSEYAVPRDYHFYIKEFSQRLENEFYGTDLKMQVFSDNSPFFERDIAQTSGLGFFGKNHLLINEKYGSFIFVGEVVLDFVPDISGGDSCEKNTCLDCGACVSACPGKCLLGDDFSECLSGLTQQKNLTETQKTEVSKHNLVWGCDICQEVCPHNKNVKETPIEFFKKERLPFVDKNLLREMSDEEFLRRAYSWRGRDVILRNLDLHE